MSEQPKQLQPDDVCDAEWAAYLALGGSLDPEPDTQSPFFDADEWRASLADGQSGRCP